jgi:hypothetical protein
MIPAVRDEPFHVDRPTVARDDERLDGLAENVVGD